MSVNRISLDANILFYAIDVDAGERHERAKEIVARSAKDFDCILALQSLAEFFASTTRKGKLTPAEAAEQVEDWQVLFPVVVARPENLGEAISAVETHNLSFWDAMLWSVVNEAGVKLLLSEDLQHERVLGGVRFRNPFLVTDPFVVPGEQPAKDA